MNHATHDLAVLDPDEATVESSFLTRWEHWTGPILIAACITPLAAGLAGTKSGLSIQSVDFISWTFFVADYLVHLRHRRFARSKLGVFDLCIVVFTAPWYLIPGAGTGLTFAMVFGRLGRVGRLFMTSRRRSGLRDLGRRIGAASLYSLLLMVLCALVVGAVEPPSSRFVSFGDSMWWSIVTFSTVGYGDLYPVSTAGRIAAAILMIGGVALIGSVAGTLGTFLSRVEPPAPAVADLPTQQPASSLTEETAVQLLAELRLLRNEVAARRDNEPGPTPNPPER